MCARGLHYSVDLRMQTYTERVSLKYEKLARVLCAYCFPLLFLHYLVVSYRCYRLRRMKMNMKKYPWIYGDNFYSVGFVSEKYGKLCYTVSGIRLQRSVRYIVSGLFLPVEFRRRFICLSVGLSVSW